MPEFKVGFVPKLPIQGNCPKVSIHGEGDEIYTVKMYDSDSGEVLFETECKENQAVIGSRQWYTNWFIEIIDSAGKVVHRHTFNLNGKVAFIKIDAYALGDNLAWVPYVDEFRKKHNCTVICSTFFNNMFKDAYKDILFVKPNTEIDNVYAQYYIGANEEGNFKYSNVKSTDVNLQRVSSSTLGLDDTEIKPKLGFSKKKRIEGKYVCISEFASDVKKGWKFPGGWQSVVDFLNKNGYKVVVISKEPTELTGVIDKTGNIPLSERMSDLYNSVFFMGVSSGLSWLNWAVGSHTVLISECTPRFHEFQNNVTRIGGFHVNKVDYEVEQITPLDLVIKSL